LILLGTDTLELLFCLIRTLTHAKNCDLLELQDRLAICSQIDEMLQRNPNYRPFSRLNTSSSTLDHSSINDWTGDLSTESLNFKLIWKIGNIYYYLLEIK
jgi:hypothetical protein